MALSVSVTPGYQFPAGFAFGLPELRLAARPTINITGSVGNTELAAASVSPDKVRPGAYWYGVDSGANDDYVVTLSPAMTALTDGAMVAFKANTVNTGAATLNANGLGAKPIKKQGGTRDLDNGDIRAGQIVECRYNTNSTGYYEMISNVANSAYAPQMFGASPYSAGESGLAPQPPTGGNLYFLRGDATWVDIQTQVNTGVAASPQISNLHALKYYHWK